MAKYPERHFETLRLILWQGLDEPPTGSLEIHSCLFNIDAEYEAGDYDAEDLVTLKGILAQSPWSNDAETRKLGRNVRRSYGYGEERFWWWPERWGV